MSVSLTSQGSFFDGVRDALVIVFTYLPVSFAFGVSAVSLGFTQWEALFLSSTMYAGASQFLVVALLASGSSIWLAALTVIALDIRHVLYGPALYQNMPKPLNMKKTAIWAWGLTDEVFARGLIELSQRKQRWSESWMLGLSLTAWGSWAMGSFLGGVFANKIQFLPKFLQATLDFLLPALFLSFLLAAFDRKQIYVVIVSILVSAVGCIFVGLSFAIFVGISAGIFTALIKYHFTREVQNAS